MNLLIVVFGFQLRSSGIDTKRGIVLTHSPQRTTAAKVAPILFTRYSLTTV
jgi:hypothetical protein